MKRIEKCRSIKVMKLAVMMVCAFLIFMGQKTISMADSTGKVKQNAIIRQSADKNSENIGGLSEGTTVTIINEVNDASGTLWYQISSGGYVRSDLIEKTDSADAAATQTTPTVSSTASGAEEQPETALDLQYATVKASPKANIRSKASKSAGVVDSMPQNTTLIISGQTNASDGVWYYVTFTGTSGSEKSGYIRNDLITLGDMVPVEEPPAEVPEEPTEEPVEEPAVSQDYAVVYEAPPNSDGQYAWYLHDYTGEQATRVKVEELLKASDAQKINAEIDAKTISKQRIAIVILVALVIILAVVLTFMFFKLRDAYIGEEEDDSDNWKAERRIRENIENREREGRSNRTGGSSRSSADRQEGQVRRKSVPSDSQQPPVRKKPVDPERKAPAKEVIYEDDGEARPKPAPKKKAKNFLADDDDFEFEFLNMKGKDKGDE